MVDERCSKCGEEADLNQLGLCDDCGDEFDVYLNECIDEYITENIDDMINEYMTENFNDILEDFLTNPATQ
jgi:predicted amidophosphoribosyltransferase